jgi:quercetin dioxygenase-like cupin family protein
VTLPAAQLEQIAAELALDPVRWLHLVRHLDGERSYAEIPCDTRDVNAWLICWARNSDTGFHDHDASVAAIAVVAGRISEERLTLTGDAHAHEYAAGDALTIPATAIHRVRNPFDTPAVTIHAYSPPLTRTGAYAIGSRGELLRTAQPSETELKAVA